ncbi:MAG: pilin [Patescibacteria group bacterium]
MKRISFKLSLIVAFVLVGVFSLFFISSIKVSAQVQDLIVMNTIGYSVLSAQSFVFGGYYSGNLDKKGFTTYFEFKKDDQNLDVDREETIKIVRDRHADEQNVFYSSPELKLFSNYYFRSVGYLNDNPDQKFYGNVLNLQTGYIPNGVTYPFTLGIERNGITPVCTPPQSLNNITNTCDNIPPTTPPIICTSTQVYSFLSRTCVNLISPKCTLSQYLDSISNKCVDYCTSPEVYNIVFNKCDNPAPNPSPTPNPAPTVNKGLVKCGTPTTNPCGFNDILTLINTIVDFIIIYLVVPLAAIMFAYAGFELITSGGETSKREKAKKIFTNVALGIVIILTAFLIVQTILSIVGYDKSWDWFGF